jgi:hypothetical protein
MGFNHTRVGNFNLPISLLIFFFIITGISSFAQTNWNTELLGRWAEGTCDAVEVDENYLYVGNGSYIDIYEDGEEPTFLLRLETPGIIRDIIRDGDYLYIANEEYGLRIFNVSDINNPFETGFLLLPGNTQKLLLRDNIIFSANFGDGLRIIDVGDPENPVEISSYSGWVQDLAIKGNFIFVTDGLGFSVLDITNPYNPIFIRYVPTEGLCEGLAIHRDGLFVITERLTLIFSIVDPTNPEFKYLTREIRGKRISINNNYAFITYFNEIKIVDISVPDTLFIVQIINSYGEKKSFRFKGNSMYVADSYYGLVIIDITDINNPILKYHIPSAYSTNYLVADSNYVYISDMGLRILDVTDPYNPQRIGVFQTIYGTDKIFKKDNLVFLVDGNIGGMRIIDVEYPNYPRELSQIKPPQNIINSVTVYQDYLYLAQGDSLGIWDITSPYSPIHTNTIHLTGYCSELIIKDSLLITCQAPPGGVLIYNLNNPEIPSLISTYVTPYEVQNLTRQGNYIIGGSYAGFEIIDITNPAQPYQVSFFSTPYTYDLTAVNNYLYIAFAETGIKVYDLNNISSPQEVGYYDTKGIAWSVDCWNDKIFVADSRYGMPIIRNTLMTNMADQQTVPSTFQLLQNYPNPFNPSTKIKYSVPQSSNVDLKVYDILGNEIEILVSEEKPIGTYEVTWYAENLPSGVYFYQLKAGSFLETRKMLLLK